MNRPTHLHRKLAIAAIAAAALVAAAPGRAHAQAPDATKPAPMPPSGTSVSAGTSSSGPTAAEKFKNIQVLKNIPATSSSPRCNSSPHRWASSASTATWKHANDKDDKKTKLAARKMITMMMAINADNFKGEREVTCYSCHRGATHPVGTPILSANGNASGAATPAPAPTAEVSATTALPTAQELLDKYLAAAGGAGAFEKIKTREQHGVLSIGGSGGDGPDRKFPVVITSEAPDKRVSAAHNGQQR